MLIGYSQPAISGAVGITGGTWLTADGGAACFDGKPGRKARLSWSAGGSTANYASIAATFAAATPLRILAILGLTCPVGVKVDFLGPGAAFLGSGRTIAMPDGTQGLWLVATDDGVADGSVEVRIYNDANGSAWATDGTVLDIGEVVAMPAVSAPIRDGWAVETIDPSEFSRTRGGQVNAAQMSAYRVLTANMAGMSLPNARGGGMDNGMDMARLAAAMRGGARCVAIPHYRNIDTRAPDPDAVNRSAIYGYASQIPDVTNISRGYFASTLIVEEVPAR